MNKFKFVRNRNFEVSVEFTMTYLAILQRFHLYSTYKGCYFNDK